MEVDDYVECGPDDTVLSRCPTCEDEKWLWSFRFDDFYIVLCNRTECRFMEIYKLVPEKKKTPMSILLKNLKGDKEILAVLNNGKKMTVSESQKKILKAWLDKK